MCGIFGILTAGIGSRTTRLVHEALVANSARGRDAHGFTLDNAIMRTAGPYTGQVKAAVLKGSYSVSIGNLRAEPTTEYVEGGMSIADVQPYAVGKYIVVHNGTIANDKELIKSYNLDRFKPETKIDSWVLPALMQHFGFLPFRELVGSYAIIVQEAGKKQLTFFTNYRPLYKHVVDNLTIVLTSEPLSPQDMLLPPYSWGTYEVIDDQIVESINEGAVYPGLLGKRKEKALVVFSGGLDSTVAASDLVHRGFDVTLLHFDYGCRATGPERAAVEAIAAHLDVPLRIVSTDVFTAVIGGSPLTNTSDSIAEGEAGAEYAHEWVPARNLILTSIALGIAEADGFDVLALGANMEEAGAYPDNEPEFLRMFQRMIPFAVSDGKRIRIETPVGNLMKKEIVKRGLEIDAPMHLSWSCYNAEYETVIPDEHRSFTTGVDGQPVETTGMEILSAGKRRYKHCGHCGPCYMRKKAFEINGEKDPVF